MEQLPKILPGYYRNRGILPFDNQCCRIYKGPNGRNPIPNGYGSSSILLPLDYGENQTKQRCGIIPSYKKIKL